MSKNSGVNNNGIQTINTLNISESRFSLAIFKIRVTDKVELVEANDYFFDYIGTSRNDYAGGLFERMGNSDRIMYENYIKEMSAGKIDFTLEIKINRKNRDIISWAQIEADYYGDDAKGRYYLCLMRDISKRKQMESELSELRNLYMRAISSSDEMIFDYNIDTDMFMYYKLTEENGVIVNSPNVRVDFLKNLSSSRDVYPDDLVYFYDLCRETLNHPFDIRFRRSNQKPGEYTRMRVHASVEKSLTGRPSKIIGTIRPIEDIKDNSDKSGFNEKDELTGIMNRTTARKHIEEFLLSSSVDSPYALLILDIKGFKNINDTLGHIFGDNVLIQVADTIIENIGRNDIVGRLGGDEFIIFIKNIGESAIVAICDKIRREICNIYVGEDAKIDVCIGAILEQDHSITCQELIQTADAALFELITKGGTGLNIAKEIVTKPAELKLSYVADMNLRSVPKNTEKRLSELIFELLEQAKDIDKALDTVLALVGEKKDLSRITMFRRDGSELCITRQWISRGFAAKNPEETSLYLEFQNKMKENFEEDGMGIINSDSVMRFNPDKARIMLSEGAKSIMYCNMMEFGEVVGVIAFVDCVNEREWSSIDYKAFRTITRMISAYTYKAESFKNNKE